MLTNLNEGVDLTEVYITDSQNIFYIGHCSNILASRSTSKCIKITDGWNKGMKKGGKKRTNENPN